MYVVQVANKLGTVSSSMYAYILYDTCVLKYFYGTGIIKKVPIIVKYMTVHIPQNYALITVLMHIHTYEFRIQITQ